MKYDLVVYGATGFTGQLVAAYLRTVPDLQGKRWAIAGRSASRLAALEAKLGLGAGVGQIAAELTDAAATADLVASTKAVINCAGPYSQNHAEELLGECARTGTHYSDLAGEGFWQAEMATKFHAAAEKSGAKIVLGGGVDSIPSDLGCMLAVDTLLKSGGLPDGDRPNPNPNPNPSLNPSRNPGPNQEAERSQTTRTAALIKLMLPLRIRLMIPRMLTWMALVARDLRR